MRRLRAGTTNPVPRPAPSEEEAWNLYHDAIGLEIAGRADEALLLFQQIIDTGPDTAAAQEAQTSIDALRAKLS